MSYNKKFKIIFLKCETCSKQFEAVKKHTKYCSNLCYERNPKLKQRRKEYRDNNRDKISARRKMLKNEYQAKGIWYDKYLRMNYNINQDIYNQMLKEQNEVCYICKEKETSIGLNGKIKPLSVDHCHSSGRVRGLLCSSCNFGIGMLKESIDVIESAKKYLINTQNVDWRIGEIKVGAPPIGELFEVANVEEKF